MKKKSIDELNVLVIDDDRHMRMLIRNVLFALGVKDVIDAADGKTALEEMTDFKPDLILCDLKMEPMGGMEFVKQLRKDPANPCRFVPIIMITAIANPRRLGQPPGALAAPVEAGEDVMAVLGQYPADGVAHIAGHENSDRISHKAFLFGFSHFVISCSYPLYTPLTPPP